MDKYGKIISTDDPIKVFVVSDTLLIGRVEKESIKIEDIIKPTSFRISQYPDDITVSFEMLRPYKMKVLLCKLVNSKVKVLRNVFDGRAPKGLFEKKAKLKNFAKGEYVLQIFVDEYFMGAKFTID